MADEGGSAGLASAAGDVVRQVRDAAGSVVGDVAAGRWRRAGIVGVSLGVVAAGAAAGVAIERLSVGREIRRRAEAELDAAAAFGSLRGTPLHLTAPDGTDLYAELDGTGWAGTDAPVAREAGERAAGSGVADGTRTPEALGPGAGAERGTPTGAAASRRAADPQGVLQPGRPETPGRARTQEAFSPPAGAERESAPRSGAGSAAGAPGGRPAQPAQSDAEAQPSARPRRLRGWLGRRRGGAAEPQPGALGGVLSGVGSWLGLPPAPPLTVVFVHGYCLNQDSWHFQREAFRDGLRLVFYDQRSHGRSERSRSYLAGEPASIDQLGEDLGAVIDAVAPTGPLVLVGHSMGGMTVMALAAQRPELFAERVAGVALLGTTAGNWRDVTLGLPGVGAKVFHRVGPGVIKALGRQAGLVERGRRLSSELTSAVYHRFSFGTDDVDPARARFAQQLLEATPVDVVAEFFPAFPAHDKTAALATMRDLPTLVLAGDRDLLTPPAHSEAIAERLPDAELEILPDTGHLLMLERPELVNARLAQLLERAAAYRGAALPPSVHALARSLDRLDEQPA
jgi:pimeloyl-ACP methyl ester carboxylesterase